MAITPGNIRVRASDSPVPIEFTSWTFAEDEEIGINPLSTDQFGPPAVELSPFPWRFENIQKGPGGAGVTADLLFDRSDDQALLWDEEAELKLFCEYKNNPHDIEVLTVKLQR